jgi:hypothetical protein
VLILPPLSETQAKKCARRCGVCHTCKRGKKGGKRRCKPAPNGSLCAAGSCVDGVCVASPAGTGTGPEPMPTGTVTTTPPPS